MTTETQSPKNLGTSTRLRAPTKAFLIGVLALVLWITLPPGDMLDSAEAEAYDMDTQGQPSTNLLLNPGFEENFYHESPGHWVAEDWYRWWIHLSALPEYVDSKGASSTRPIFEGEHAQAMQIWSRTYTAGIYQVVHNVTPCTLYELSVWTRNESLDDALPHAKIGLDPEGTQLTPYSGFGAVLGLPTHMQWSREQTALSTWENLSVTAEPVGGDLTAVFYSSPEKGTKNATYYFDSIWDAASLTQVPFPNGRLPVDGVSTDSGFIQNVTAKAHLNTLIVEWDTSAPASTQVIYRIHSASETVTPTIPYSHTVYVPMISRAGTEFSTHEGQTFLDGKPVLHHRAVIADLEEESTITISYIPLSRHPDGSVCTTKASTSRTIKIETPNIYRTFIPLVTSETDTINTQSYGR